MIQGGRKLTSPTKIGELVLLKFVRLAISVQLAVYWKMWKVKQWKYSYKENTYLQYNFQWKYH